MRRGNGQGSVVRRGKTWQARVTIRTALIDGRVVQERRSKGGFATKTEALQYMATLYEEQRPRVPTLADYYKVWSDSHLEKLSASKQTAYGIAWTKLEDIACLPIDEITVRDLQALVNDRCPTYYPARDVKVLLNQLYKLAAADGNANVQVPGLIELPKLEEKETQPFTEAEQQQLWRAYENGVSDAAIPLVMIYTGMMPGELRDLRRGMIRWDDHEIDSSVGLKTQTRRTKSVLLPNAILPVLEDLCDRAEGDLVLDCTESMFYIRYYRALEQAGITRRLTPYSCRHTAATALAITGSIAPQTVQRLMRWGSTRMMDRYVHPTDDDAKNALQTRRAL